MKIIFRKRIIMHFNKMINKILKINKNKILIIKIKILIRKIIINNNKAIIKINNINIIKCKQIKYNKLM